MGLTAILAGASVLVIKMYRWLKANDKHESVLASVSQQAAVIGTFASAVFSIIEAVVNAKMRTTTVAQAVVSASGIGRPAGYYGSSALAPG